MPATPDTPLRRNRIAAITAEYFDNIAEQIERHPDTDGKQVSITSVIMRATYAAIKAALHGETDPKKLGIDPLSLPAVQIANLCNED